MKKNYDSISRIVAYASGISLFFFVFYYFFKTGLISLEKFYYVLDFSRSINILSEKFKHYFIFVLIFPLLISLGYLLSHISLKFFGFEYKNYSYAKELTIFFGFLYYFFFIIILIDFVYFIEIQKIPFNLTDEEVRALTSNIDKGAFNLFRK